MNKPLKPSVVVADDDHMMREMLKLILHSDDYQVVGEASNGEDAITLCEKHKPGLVLLDINMPKMDGLQALEQIRKISTATIVLMVSAEATMDRVREAILLGASGFVVKPLNQASVLDRITMALKKKG
ncbi:MAG: response regulator [Gallionella sp.]|nr:response regulator [Gallionella sp.]